MGGSPFGGLGTLGSGGRTPVANAPGSPGYARRRCAVSIVSSGDRRARAAGACALRGTEGRSRVMKQMYSWMWGGVKRGRGGGTELGAGRGKRLGEKFCWRSARDCRNTAVAVGYIGGGWRGAIRPFQ